MNLAAFGAGRDLCILVGHFLQEIGERLAAFSAQKIGLFFLHIAHKYCCLVSLRCLSLATPSFILRHYSEGLTVRWFVAKFA